MSILTVLDNSENFRGVNPISLRFIREENKYKRFVNKEQAEDGTRV